MSDRIDAWDALRKDDPEIADLIAAEERRERDKIRLIPSENYVSHAVADYTAILKFIETRFGVPALNKRDAAQIDMTEFFDFANPPWMTPPTPPAQSTSGPCYLDHLP